MTKNILSITTIIALLFTQFSIVSAENKPSEIYKNNGFTIQAANPNTIKPNSFLFELKPGESTEEYVEIRNLSQKRENFLLYGADPTFSAQGTPAYKTRQSSGEGEGEGKWIKFDNPSITLDSDETVITKFILSVPENAPLGDYRTGIAMEKSKKDINNPSITIATRLIIHADIKVTNNPKPIPKTDSSFYEKQETIRTNTLKTVYFWLSLTLFLASFIALIWITLQERKKEIAPQKIVSKKKTTKKPTKNKAKSKPKTTKKTVKKTTKKRTKTKKK